MLKRLRRQFVVIIVALVGAVLVCTLGVSVYNAHASQQRLVEDSLEASLEGKVDSVPTIGGAKGKPGEVGADPSMLAVCVDVSSEGVIVQTSDSPVYISSDTLSAVVSEAVAADEDSGYMGDLHVSWKRATTSTGFRVAIVDVAAADKLFESQLTTTLLGGAAALVALFVVAWFLSGWVLKPVERAWEQQRRFVADASHELKTPLAVISANNQILQKDEGLTPEARRWVDSTADETKRMQDLVGDLLQLAKTDEGASGASASALNMKDGVDLSDIVESAALEFDAVAFDKGCSIDAEVQEGLTMRADPEWLDRLVRILIDNAVKYADKGSTVRVALGKADKHTQLTVNNHGNVIDPEDLAHIFDRFYRSDKARSRESGTGGFGLGLAIAKGIAEAHGGRIAATSSEAEGTTFTVTF